MTVNILGKESKVYIKDKPMEILHVDFTHAAGSYDISSGDINIVIDGSKDMDGSFRTLVHEMIHGVMHSRNIFKGKSYTADQHIEVISILNDEAIVDGVATGVIQLIKDNPKLFSNFILGEKYHERARS